MQVHADNKGVHASGIQRIWEIWNICGKNNALDGCK